MKLRLLERRECTRLTLTGKLLLFVAVVALALAARSEAYPFLAPSHPVVSDTLVVEGWISEHVLNQVADEFRRGNYKRLVVVQSKYDDNAEENYKQDEDRQDDKQDDSKVVVIRNGYVSRELAAYGVPSGSMWTLLYLAVERDRTYHGALAVKDWLAATHTALASFNVVTVGAHARRSWLLYRKAFDDATGVGIVALRDPTFNPSHWWDTSEGVREVLGEAIAYIYARFFFWG